MNKKLLVVLVHGLNGNKKSFQNAQGKYLDELIQNCLQDKYSMEVKYFTYPTGVLNNTLFAYLKQAYKLLTNSKTKVKLNNPIQVISKQLQSSCEIHLKEYTDLIFIGHSMGGLIIKDALTNPILLNKTRLYITLATPHYGVKNSVSWFWLFSNQVKDLDTFNKNLNRINKNWEDIKHLVNKKFYIASNDLIVPEISSTSNTNDYIEFDEDHQSIAKVEDNSLLLESIVSNIEQNLLWLTINSDRFKIILDDIVSKDRIIHSKIILNNSLEYFLFYSDKYEVSEFINSIIQKKAQIQSKKINIFTNRLLSKDDNYQIIEQLHDHDIVFKLYNRLDIEKLFKMYDDIVQKHTDLPTSSDLSTSIQYSNKKIHIDEMSYIGNFTNRFQQKKDLKKILLRQDFPIVILVGLSGVGKSVLASNIAYELKDRIEGLLAIKFHSLIETTDILYKFNVFFMDNNIDSFNNIYSNGRFNDDERVYTLVKILQEHNFIIIFDNFEDILDSRYKINNNVINELLNKIIMKSIKSKIIITSQSTPNINETSNQIQQYPILSIEKDDLKSHYIHTLPNLKKYFKENEDDKIIDTVMEITAGIPMALNILDKYILNHTLDDVKQIVIEKTNKELLSSLIKTVTSQTRECLYAVALIDEYIEYKFFEYFSLSHHEINNLLSTGLISMNISKKYLMHTSIKKFIIASIDDKKKNELLEDILGYYESIKFSHIDTLESHFNEKRKLNILIQKGDFDLASEKLGRIGTRYISRNSIDEISAKIFFLEKHNINDKSIFWLLNVKAHIEDYKKNFNATIDMYKQQYELATSIEDTELLALATNNYATTFRREQDFKTAITYYHKSKRIARKNNFNKILGTVHNNLGQTYGLLKKHKLAIKMFLTSIKYRILENDGFRLAATYSHLGEVYLDYYELKQDKKILSEAYFYLDESVKYQKKQENFWLIDRTYEALAKYFHIINNEEKENEFLKLANDNKSFKNIYKSVKIN